MEKNQTWNVTRQRKKTAKDMQEPARYSDQQRAKIRLGKETS